MASCCRRRFNRNSKPSIIKTKAGQVAYKGLMRCGLVWECTVDAPLITERRRADLHVATYSHKKTGGYLLHLIQTVPHGEGDALGDLKEKFYKARRLMRNRKPWKKIMKMLGLVGSVMSLEVRDGENGWHPHTHELLFCKSPLVSIADEDLWRIADQLLIISQSAYKTAGLRAPNRRGIDLKGAQNAENYISKWGAEEELTKSHVKKGRGESLTPWDLLRQYHDSGDKRAGARWLEFADAFKGSHQLTWSKGLREALNLGADKTDEEIANEDVSSGVTLAVIEMQDWVLVLKRKARGMLLQIAKDLGADGIYAFLLALKDPTFSF